MNKINPLKFTRPAFCFLAIAHLSLFLSGCGGKRDVRLYYFPINDLKQAKVYEYRAVHADSLAPYYWYYQTIVCERRWLSEHETGFRRWPFFGICAL